MKVPEERREWWNFSLTKGLSLKYHHRADEMWQEGTQVGRTEELDIFPKKIKT